MTIQPEPTARAEGDMDKYGALAKAFDIARETGIAGYAIETKFGWIADKRKPSLRFGKVFECLEDGSVNHG